MEPRYTIYFAGDLLEGQEPADVRGRLAKLFNADEPTLDRLFSGKPQVLKRDCDKATALKYKQAIEGAGARPIVQASEENAVAPTPAPAQKETPEETTDKPMTMAERIAALAEAPDVGGFGPGRDENKPKPPPPRAPGEPEIAPVGSDILRPEERHNVVAHEIDTGSLEVAGPVERLAPEPAAPPPAPDTGHLDVGEVGDTIPNLPSEQPTPPPDSAGMDLAPVGADFSEFSPPEPEEPALDISDMNLAPSGTDMLEEKYRQREPAQGPPTDHISLED